MPPADTAFPDPLDDFTDRQTLVKMFDQYLRAPHSNDYLLTIEGNR